MPVDFGYRVAADVALIERTGTKHYGLQPYFGIFQHSPSRVEAAYFLRQTSMSPAQATATADELLDKWHELGVDEFHAYVRKTYPELAAHRFYDHIFGSMSAKPEDLFDIAPYIYCVHGKFLEMRPVEGRPGEYEEPSIAYEEGIAVLKAIGYEGWIDSEFEGQRSQQDMGDDGLANEVEQVRRHQEMLKRLIGE